MACGDLSEQKMGGYVIEPFLTHSSTRELPLDPWPAQFALLCNHRPDELEFWTEQATGRASNDLDAVGSGPGISLLLACPGFGFAPAEQPVLDRLDHHLVALISSRDAAIVANP